MKMVRHNVVNAWLLCAVAELQLCSAQMANVCSPANMSEPLICTNNQWVRIKSELYASRLGGVARCQIDLGDCNNFVYDVGLSANCNGPVHGERAGACREDVDVEAARTTAQCLHDVADMATLIQYECIPASSIYDVCDATVVMAKTSFNTAYLVSPDFPSTEAVQQYCTCDIQGSHLLVSAIDVDVTAKLQWVNKGPENVGYDSVLNIQSGDEVLWGSNRCYDCEQTILLNSAIIFPSVDPYSQMTLNYSDYGLPGQKVWLEIKDIGPSLNISCSSSPLPIDRIIITTTTTTTPMSSLTTTTPSATTLTTKVTPRLTRRPTIPPTTIRVSHQRTHTTPTSGGNDAKDDKSDSDAITALVVVLIGLILVTVILGLIIYKKRHKFKNLGLSGIGATINSWFQQLCGRGRECRSDDDGEDNTGQLESQRPYSHDNMVFDGVIVDNQDNEIERVKTRTTYSYDYPDPALLNDHSSANRHEPHTKGTSTHNSFTGTDDKYHLSHTPSHKHKTDLSKDSPEILGNSKLFSKSPFLAGEEGVFIIKNELYVTHQQMLDDELTRLRMEIRLKRQAAANSLKLPQSHTDTSSQTIGQNGGVEKQSKEEKPNVHDDKSQDAVKSKGNRGLVNAGQLLNTVSVLRFNGDYSKDDPQHVPLPLLEPTSGRQLVQGASNHRTASHRNKHRRYIKDKPDHFNKHNTENRRVSTSNQHALLEETHLSHEEKKLFDDLGISDLSKQHSKEINTEQDKHIGKSSNSEHQTLVQNQNNSNPKNPDNVSNETSSTSKGRKPVKPELVSRILQLSLDHIKERRLADSGNSHGCVEQSEMNDQITDC